MEEPRRFVRPVRWDVAVEDIDLARSSLEALVQLQSLEAFQLLRNIANSLAYEAYIKMLGSKSQIDDSYSKGVIGGLEALFQNIEENTENLKDFLNEHDNPNKEAEDETELRAKALGIDRRTT